MDDQRRQRQNDPSVYSGNTTRYSQESHPRTTYPAAPGDRYRPAPLNVSPPSSRRVRGVPVPTSTATSISGAASSSPSGSTTGTNYGYYSESSTSFPSGIQSSTMQYPAGYGADQRQQNFAAYTSNLMYNVPQETNQNSIYESTQQFPTRQPASMQMLGDTATYFSNEPTSASAPASTLPQHGSSSTAYQTSSADRSSVLPGYSAGMTLGGLVQTAGASEVMDDQDYTRTNLDTAYTQYQTSLRNIFTNIKDKMLLEASQSLLETSNWLLPHVVDLGLTVDNAELQGDRVRLWNEFNNAWLALFQTQKEMILDSMEGNQQLRHPQNILTYSQMEKMAKELVRLCDGVEKFGLVDYQYGVWEEYIMTALTDCLDLLDEQENTQNNAGQ